MLCMAACAVVASAAAGPGCAAEVRSMRYTPRSAEKTVAWQSDVRARLFRLLKMDDQVTGKRPPIEPKERASFDAGGVNIREITVRSTNGREIEVVLAVPKTGSGPFPAVVCIGGHGSNVLSTFTNGQAFGAHVADTSDHSPIYKGFAVELARRGYITIATSVSQHEVREPGRTLNGERLWDLMRCVDLLESMPAVDKGRIGCAGLSLGGEMAMWLAAMDTRIAACVSAGFLTNMDQLEHNHCMCWKFDGLRELVDFADIYSLIAPRPLQCQNGRKEPESQFPPKLARRAIGEIYPAYAAFGCVENASLDIHDGAHEIDLPALLGFFDKHLGVG